MAVLAVGNEQVVIHVEREEEETTNTVSKYPIQAGNNITDHTQREEQTITFEGLLFGKDRYDIQRQWQQLLDWQSKGSILQYAGAIWHGNMMITTLHRIYEDGGYKNAIKFEMELTYIDIVQSSYVKAMNVGPKAPSPPANPGVWVTVRPGNTYWGWWKQYGTPIQTLRNWNHWPDRRIPVGVRARVK